MKERIRTQHGFTLVELMITIAILAILAVVALTSYKVYIRRARAQEGRQLLMEIKMKQEHYFSTYSQYVDTDGGNGEITGLFPNTAQDKFNQYSWSPMNCAGAAAGSAVEGWCHLGVRPTQPQYFKAVTIGWNPTKTAAPTSVHPIVTNMNFSLRWYYAVAVADQDGDGSFSTFIMTSQTNEIIEDFVTE